MFLFQRTKLFSTLFVLLIVFYTANEAKPFVLQENQQSQEIPACPGCQRRDLNGRCQNTNTILKDGKCYYVDNSVLHFDAGPIELPKACTGCQKKDITGKCQDTTTVQGRDDKCYYVDISMLPFYADTIPPQDPLVCTGCQKKDIAGICRETTTILKDGKCYYVDPRMPVFDAGMIIFAEKLACALCQQKDIYGICQDTNTILKDAHCYSLDPSLSPFDAIPSTVACPRCQRRDMSGICGKTDTILTRDGKCHYYDKNMQPFDALPDLPACPGCQKKDISGTCQNTTTILEDGECYYIDLSIAPFDEGPAELPAIKPRTKSDIFIDIPVCAGCQKKDIKGICRPTATVLRDGKCYYRDPHVPHFDAGPTDLSDKQTPAKSDYEIFVDTPVCLGCEKKDIKGVCQPTATTLRDGKCYYSDPRMPHFNAGKPRPK